LFERQEVVFTHSKPPGPKPDDRPFIRFVLAKSGYDTASAISRIAGFVGIDKKYFCFASAKDKGAITFQEVTVPAIAGIKPVDCDRLCTLDSKFPRLLIGNMEYCKEPLSAGAHGGNMFTVLLRRIDCSDIDRIHEAVETVSKRGFINYFGHHRLVTSSSHPEDVLSLKPDEAAPCCDLKGAS
jgi:TruD family tRNA pseudouridine synthase